jgi:hypothetical protein
LGADGAGGAGPPPSIRRDFRSSPNADNGRRRTAPVSGPGRS